MGQRVIQLLARTSTSAWGSLPTDVWRVGTRREPGEHCAILLQEGVEPDVSPLYVSRSPDLRGPGPTIHLPQQLQHVCSGDVIVVPDDGQRVQVVWKTTAAHNSILLTERCENYCLMCSQPPKDRNDSYLYTRAERIVSALPPSARALGLTGGEPTIDPEAFLRLLHHCAAEAPALSIHVLSNGRRFADRAFAQAYAEIPLADAMVGIPLYGSEPGLHDYVVQAEGAFNQAVKGILNLAAFGRPVEIRVVIQKHTVPALGEIATYIARNLPFASQVALMGLEMTGLARPNAALVWVDPADYQDELLAAYNILRDAGIATRLYNHQLCVTDERMWPAAVQSISDWKNDYPDLCSPCAVKDRCCGVFTTSGNRLSQHLQPILC